MKRLLIDGVTNRPLDELFPAAAMIGIRSLRGIMNLQPYERRSVLIPVPVHIEQGAMGILARSCFAWRGMRIPADRAASTAPLAVAVAPLPKRRPRFVADRRNLAHARAASGTICSIRHTGTRIFADNRSVAVRFKYRREHDHAVI